MKRDFGGVSLICRLNNNNDPKICLTDEMLPKLVRWYHEATVHAEGMTRLENTIRRHFHHPKLRNEIQNQINNCQICARNKYGALPYGQLAPRDALPIPWYDVHVDTIGPWTVKIQGIEMTFQALTSIEPVTNLLEIQRIRDKTSDESWHAFQNSYLSRYPRPARCVHDGGPEFIGHEFQFGLMDAGIYSQPITPKNPTSNAIIEAVHKTVGQVIRTLVDLKPPESKPEAERLVDTALATAMYACRCASNSSLGHFSSGALVFETCSLIFLLLPMSLPW